ncbi:cellulose binding domain-containing protein [Flectobacillus rivi]|uniref:Cellulose binding domain-containing protein n=1 Tax=Flectobacillus rivi TaxID=2984209 RepID=A0ABT6YYX7_9BACT|nr:cellulose binding domain-containing protein [Flectobacillus rivi]MDI9874084.1 cellulose binding domain-containing protein [Flectobacillus rivi]
MKTSLTWQLRLLFLIIVGLMPYVHTQAQTFTHPGVSHKKSDLDRMKAMVAAGIEPWKSSFKSLSQSPYASYSYAVRGNGSTTLATVSTITGFNYDDIKYDGLAAYCNALMWYVTGDERHAKKAVEIFNAWSYLQIIKTGGTRSLDAGRVIWKLLEGAEIIKHTYTGWNATDLERFKSMLVYPGYSSTVEPTAQINNEEVTFYWFMYNGDAGRHGNQGIFGMRGVAAMGIFLDNRVMYERSIRYLKGLPHRADDLPYPAGPPINGTTPTSASNEYQEVYALNGFDNSVPDYGYNELIQNYVWENGQCQESARDQTHSLNGVGNILTICEMAWNQGDDIYSFLDNRLLKGMEYSYRYNVSLNYPYPDQTTPWEPTVESGEFISRRDRTGRWQSLRMNPLNEGKTATTRATGFKFDRAPITEMVLGHYRDRIGVSANNYKWTQRAYDISTQELGVESQGFEVDYPGWGGLTFHRTSLSPGDACSFVNGKPVFAIPHFPATIEAENFDYMPTDGQNKTYYDLSNSNTGGQFRPNEAVDIESRTNGGYHLTSLEAGEWVNYTVNVPTAGRFKININALVLAAGGKIKIEFDGTDKTGEFDIRANGNSAWQTITVAPQVSLHAGVQSMRIKIVGVSNAFKLDNIVVEYLGALPTQTISFPAIATKSFGAANFNPSASASSGLPVTYMSSNTSVATIVNGLVQIVGVGSCLITASQQGNDDYAAAQSVSRTLLVTGIAAGDYLSSGNMNWNGGTWNISDGNGGIASSTTTAPTANTNVHILTGHTVTLSTVAGSCKSLTVNAQATLTETIALTVANTLIMDGTMTHTGAITANGDVFVGGIWTASSNLTVAKNFSIQSSGVYKSSTAPGGSVFSLTVNGNDAVVRVDGTLGGTTTGNSTVGEGIRLYLGGSGSPTVTGTGIVNIARFQPTGNNIQNIIFDIDMNFGNNSVQSSGINTLSLLAGTSNKTLTINAGKTVKISNPNGSFHSPTNATEDNTVAALKLGGTQNYGNMTYNILGTLDVSQAHFVLYSNTSTSNPSAVQTIAVNVGTQGILKLGSDVRMAKNAATQNIFVNVADGGIIDATTAPLNLTIAPISANGHTTNGSGQLWFTMAPNAVYKQALSAGVATPLWVGVSNTSYNPVTITPNAATVVETSLQTGFGPSGLETQTIQQAVNRTWNLKTSDAVSSSLKFGFNASDLNAGASATQGMKLIRYNSSTNTWEKVANSTPQLGQNNSFTVSYDNVSPLSNFVLSNRYYVPVNITNLSSFYCKNAPAVTLTGTPTGGTFTVDGSPVSVFDPASLSSGMHTVIYALADGENSDTLQVEVGVSLIAPSISGAGVYFMPNPVTLTASGCSGTVHWSNNTSGNTLTISGLGSYSYTATCVVNGCVSPISDVTNVEIKKLDQMITFEEITNKYIDEADFTPVVSSNAGLAISLVSSDTSIAKISNGLIKLVGVGTVQITASQSGNGNYNPAANISRSFSILSSVKIKYQNGDNSTTNNQIKPFLTLVNESNHTIPYNELTVKYWFTPENYTGINTWIDYAALGNSNVKMSYSNLPNPRNNALGYVEYSFLAAAGNLGANANSGVIQSRFANTDWSDLNEQNDYSWSNTNSTLLVTNITVYRNGKLIWGQEPSLVPVNQSLKVYANSKSQPNSNTISTYLTLNNEGNSPVNYKDVKVRYWFTKDGSANLNTFFDYVQIGNAQVNGTFGSVSNKQGADSYFDLGFNATAGVLYPLSNSGNINFRIAKTDWSNFNQNDDYSYMSVNGNSLLLNTKISVYYQGNLIFGSEPNTLSNNAIGNNLALIQYSVYPNPSSQNNVKVALKNDIKLENDVPIRVYNSTGMLITEKIVEAGETRTIELNLPDQLTTGVYYIQLGNMPSVKLILQK